MSKAGYFIGLSGAIGSTVTYAASVRPAVREATSHGDDVEVTRHRAASCLAWAGVVLLVAGYFQLAARLARAGKGMPFGDALSPARIWAFLRAPAGKDAWIAQGTIHLVQNTVLLLASAVLIALFLPRARRHLNAIALTALPAALAVTLIAAVPATAPKNADKVLDLVFDQVHFVSGVVWIGQLWTTTYGLFVLVKILLVLGMVAAGAVNQFWLMPRILKARRDDDASSLLHLTLRHFPKVVWGEVALGIAVLGVVPFLSGSARSEAGSPPAVSTGSIFAVGALLVVTLAASLYITVKTSDALARRATPTTA
ncbi:CopD family protein [Streptomyces sp. NPDC001194]|uniref:CopD family protein n=1 Tax=Streptomyces sp. NPDC001194 TaxID=3364547 RepID=UPI00367374FB